MAVKGSTKTQVKSSKKHIQSPWGGFFFVLPSIIAMAIFVYGMIGWTLKFSFSNRTSPWNKDNSFAGVARYTELLDDPEFKKRYDADPDWNNANKHDIADILDNDFFTKYVNIEGWGSDSPPFVCTLFCKKGAKGMKGYHALKQSMNKE